MSDHTIDRDSDTRNDKLEDPRPIGKVRYLPAATFGLRAAALAGLIIAGGAAGLGGEFGGLENAAFDPIGPIVGPIVGGLEVPPAQIVVTPSTCCPPML